MAFPAALVARRGTDVRIGLGLAGLAAAVAVRIEVSGVDGVRSVPGGLVFGVLTAALAAVLATRTVPTMISRFAIAQQLALGLAGAAVLCVPAAIRHLDGVTGALPLAGYAPWALGVTIVAVAEETLLRGSLFTALQDRTSTGAAIAVTSVAFALLHVPLYGTGVLPIDLAVGVWLGSLRAVTGSVTVPAIAHTVADLAGWWLR